MELTSTNKSTRNKPCRRIALDFDNERILRRSYPHVSEKTSGGLLRIEVENIQECVSRARGDRPAQYKYVGTRYVYRVEDEHEFFLLLIEIGIQYEEVNPNSYSCFDTGDENY